MKTLRSIFMSVISNKAKLCLMFLATALAGCMTNPPPSWKPVGEATETEYQPYLGIGSGTVTGRASLVNRRGIVVEAAGRTVTLDPATSVGNEWWDKAGKIWINRSLTPPSPAFSNARRTTVADDHGRFTFAQLPPGKYYVRTEVTWKIGNYNSIQGGLVGTVVEVRNGATTDVVLDHELQ